MAKRKLPRYLVEARASMSCCLWRVVNLKVHRELLKASIEPNVWEGECLIQSIDEIENFVPKHRLKEFWRGWPVRFYVYDAEVEARYGVPI